MSKRWRPLFCTLLALWLALQGLSAAWAMGRATASQSSMAHCAAMDGMTSEAGEDGGDGSLLVEPALQHGLSKPGAACWACALCFSAAPPPAAPQQPASPPALRAIPGAPLALPEGIALPPLERPPRSHG